MVLDVSKHNGKVSCQESQCIYLRNLPMTVPVEQLQGVLSTYGTLVGLCARWDNAGLPFRVIFGQFDCVASARTAVDALHIHLWRVHPLAGQIRRLR